MTEGALPAPPEGAMNTKLRVANLITSIFTSIVMLAGLIFPIFFSLPMTLSDIIITLFNGVDGTYTDQWVTGAGWILMFCIIMGFSAFVVFILSIACFFITKRPLFRLSTAFLIINDVLLFMNVGLQFVCAVWLNSQYNNPTTRIERNNIFYVAPIAESVLFAALIVLTVFSIRSMLHEKDFQDLLRSMKERNKT
ncbi:MAG: hypothetical protein J6X37_04035 [Treponema sp.]|nr:hypothetical protein [Treponema sp.]